MLICKQSDVVNSEKPIAVCLKSLTVGYLSEMTVSDPEMINFIA
jgi:hypothetical protein